MPVSVPVGAFAHDRFAYFDGAGEGDGFDARIAGEGRADVFAVAGDEVEDAGGQGGFVKDFGEHQGGERRLFGGFEDDGVAAEEGGGGFPDGDGAGEIPGSYQSNRAKRNAQSVEETIVHRRRNRAAGKKGVLVGVEIEQADGAIDFAAGFGDDFALFFDEQSGGHELGDLADGAHGRLGRRRRRSRRTGCRRAGRRLRGKRFRCQDRAPGRGSIFFCFLTA